jgi:hypothetical protein
MMTGTEAAKVMEDFVNGNRDKKEFVEYIVNNTHRTLNQSLIGLFIAVLKYEAGASYDGRNEASVKFCKSIEKQLDEVYLPYI